MDVASVFYFNLSGLNNLLSAVAKFLEFAFECLYVVRNGFNGDLWSLNYRSELASSCQWGSAKFLKSLVYEVGLYREVLDELRELCNLLLLLTKTLVSLLCGESYVIRLFSESHVGVVRAKQYPVLGSRCEHAVWFVNTLCHQVINEHTNVCLVAAQCKVVLSVNLQCRVYSGNESLAGGLLISGCSVHLSGKVESFYNL